MESVRWQCRTISCLHGDRWWRSRHGVIQCLNCKPPLTPDLIVESGDIENAPLVLASCDRIAADAGHPDRDDRPRSPLDALRVGSPVWVLRGGRTPEKLEPKGKRRNVELPADATHWCCEGDPQWTRIERSDREKLAASRKQVEFNPAGGTP